MPYMEHQFQALTSVRLNGLSQFTGWIKPGSYYHGVVARKGQVHLCLHLGGTTPPRGPQIHPSQTQALMQKKVDTLTTSHPTPGREGSMTQGARSNPPIPMETGGAGGWPVLGGIGRGSSSSIRGRMEERQTHQAVPVIT